MTFDLSDCVFVGPALPDPFIRFELADQLARLGLLDASRGSTFERGWSDFRHQLPATGGAQRVRNRVLAPLAERLGMGPPIQQDEVLTREGAEDGGWVMHALHGGQLRAWAVGTQDDIDASVRGGHAYRFSPARVASRVLQATGERIGLLTDGDELRVVLCDAVRPDSHIAIPLLGGNGWRARASAPDSYRLVLALGGPRGIAALPQILDAARLSQTRVTKDLRVQARRAIEAFVQAVLDHPKNAGEPGLVSQADKLWHEALILVYRLLFILKLESTSDPARAFSFASTRLWREMMSPNRALGPLVRRFLDHGHDTGRMLEDGLRLIFRVFRDGLSCSEVSIAALGGALFGVEATPVLDRLAWGERAIALLLDRLLWTMPKGRARERVHYGALDVEDLGRVYEALLELEPGITAVPMSRMRRAKLEVVTAIDLPERHARRATGVYTERIEVIAAGRFFLRAGIGRKVTGSYYTPHGFVRFLVQQTLGPQIARRSPDDDPDPAAILAMKVVDPATGSGHFLVEACRFLGEALYAACRACDVLATEATDTTRAAMLRGRVAELPDSEMLLAYLPSRASEGTGSGVSQSRALAICRRLVAVHCLYGVDSNGLAIELAKLSLWLESYAENLPLTFLDHRLVHGNSIAGGYFQSLMKLPVGGAELDPLLAGDVAARLDAALRVAVREVGSLQATVGTDAADIALKAAAKQRMDAVLRPLRLLARAWSGAVMLATRESDDEWLDLARFVAMTGGWLDTLTERQAAMLHGGRLALPWELEFPEVFWRDGDTDRAGGFDAVLSNPPWDIMQPNTVEFLAGFDLSVLDATGIDVRETCGRLLADPEVASAWHRHRAAHVYQNRIVARLYHHQRTGANGGIAGGKLDLYRVFAERMFRLAGPAGAIGMVVPSAFHANEGSTGVRQLYLAQTRLEHCLSFENRKKLFEIDGRFRFALVVAHRPGPTKCVNCGFYLADLDDIAEPGRVMQYSREFIATSGGRCASLLELRHRSDLALAERMFCGHAPFGSWCRERGIALSRELHMTDDARKFVPVGKGGDRGHLPLHEGKTIHQFKDRWDTRPRYFVAWDDLAGKPGAQENSRYYRAACREIAGSTNERTVIAAMLPPGVVCGHTINVERQPARRSNASALILVALLNSFAFDWLLRSKAATHVSLYILSELPVPCLTPVEERLLAHMALRLCCNHRCFARLWHEQLGSAWLEAAPGPAWPVIPEEADRWRLRAAIDAVVAHGYGLDRAQYERILASFSHKSFTEAPDLCLASFDTLERAGLSAFCTKVDAYLAVPLPEGLARPAYV